MLADEVLLFWFSEIDPKQWWVKDEALDALIRSRFLPVHQRAVQGQLAGWRSTADGRLAEVIVLDQFSRNLFRDSAQAFAYDHLALTLAQEAVAVGIDGDLNQQQRSFLYMPYMHSESLSVHEQAVDLFQRNGIAANLDFELQHKAIIERFGRYPHRNAVLGRVSTAEELSFLAQPGSSF